MPSITRGGRGGLFSTHRGALLWLRRCQSPLLSTLAGGGGRSDAPHLPVLIVGAGPVGLVLSFLLTKFGTDLVPPLLIDVPIRASELGSSVERSKVH
ncbi:FAD/NAD(P)-binding oxidoreductase family protein [Zea mays]|uniref:FAD/NAD(P)-binding oxidoreductase family protein n=1 Tax=Zea mays TaxID=4577 RepID=A0A1D6K0Q3_MAIZE|nr:FAD/NAD(P)-binding oxidoreductase family protein [Zea mays]ONL97334.1 FAD/NAD(P)-binding oxidoreductase family protein [Zea mays]